MSTKPPSKVKEFAQDSLEKIAYNAVKEIPALEPNDLNRLGYHVFQWLKNKNGTLRDAIKIAEVRILITEEEAYNMISENLKKYGI